MSDLGMLTAPRDRWIEDAEALDACAEDRHSLAVDCAIPDNDEEWANALYQQMYACRRAAALLRAVLGLTDPHREVLAAALGAEAMPSIEEQAARLAAEVDARLEAECVA